MKILLDMSKKLVQIVCDITMVIQIILIVIEIHMMIPSFRHHCLNPHHSIMGKILTVIMKMRLEQLDPNIDGKVAF